MTINEAMIWQKTLQQRHSELVQLRNENSTRETRYLGANADKTVVKEALYDVRKLDAKVTKVAMQMRLLDQAIKATNAKTQVEGFTADESVLDAIE